jgi:conjugal transfer ATP-binding protein TraC
LKLKLIDRGVRTSPASSMIHLETYTTEDRLIVSKPDGDKLMIGRAIEASALIAGGGDFGMTVNAVIRSAPDNSVVQVSLIGSPDFDGPARYVTGKDQGSRAVSELVQRHRGVLERALEVGWQEEEPVLSTRRVLISLAVPVADTSPTTLSEAAIKQADFLANVKRSGFRDAQVLSASDVVGVYRWFFNIFKQRVSPELDELVDLRFQVFGPDQELDFRDEYVGKLGHNCYCAAVAIKSFPEEPRAGVMNIATGGIFRDRKATEGGGPKITSPFIFTTTVRVANQRAEGTRVQRAIDSRLNKAAPFKLGREDSVRKLADLKIIQSQCAEGEDKYVYVSTSAFLFGKTADQARSAAGVVAGLLDKLKFDAREVANNLPVRLSQALPLNYSLRLAEGLQSEALMSSSGSALVLPLYGDYSGNVPPGSAKSGFPLITRRGQLMSVDIWRGAIPHGFICAQSGGGKTVALETKIFNQLAEGTRVVAIDDGRSLKKFCHAVGGEFNEFGAERRPSLNSFSLIESDEDFNDQEELISELALQMAYHNEEPISGARIALSEATKAAWANRGNRADFFTIVEALDSIVRGAVGVDSDNELTVAARTLVPRLKSFLDSPARGAYFRGKCTLDVNARFTVFEMASLGESHLKKCVLFFVTNVILSRLRHYPGRKLVLIDEAADTLKDPGAAAVVGGLYRKGRKDQVGIWVVFQSLLQAMELPAGRLIFSQSYWKWMLYQDASEVDKLVKEGLLGKFVEDPFYIQLLKSLQTVKGLYSEILVQSPDSYEVGRLFLDRFTLTLLDSEGPTRERIFELMNDGMDVVDAVELVIGQGTAQRSRWVREFVSELRDVQGLSADEIQSAVREALL